MDPPDGVPTSFAVTFHAWCGGGPEGVHGQVRWQAATPVNTAGGAFAPASLAFPAGIVNTAGPALTAVFTSTGHAPVTLGAASIEGAGASSFLVTNDGCEGSALAPGASCSISVEPIPRTSGTLFATLRVPTSALSGTRALPLSGRGLIATTTQLEASAPEAVLPDTITLTATVTPTPGAGLVSFCVAGFTTCSSVALDAAGQAKLNVNATGARTITARFRGLRDMAESTSDAVSIVLRAGTSTTLWVDRNPGSSERVVLFFAQVDPIGSARPGGGTLRIRNDLTGTTLGTRTISSNTPFTMACVRLPAGTHAISAAYDGLDGYGPSSDTLTELVQPDPAPTTPDPMPSYGSVLNEFPCIDLRIDAGPHVTTTTTVPITFDVLSLGRRVDEYALSNDGIRWSGSTSWSRSWSLTDPAFGGTDADGAKRVHARFRVGTWWSEAVEAGIALDRQAPVGSVKIVYVDGVLVRTISLYAPVASTRRVVWVQTWSTSRTRTIAIRVVGTAGHPRVDVDGFAWSS